MAEFSAQGLLEFSSGNFEGNTHFQTSLRILKEFKFS